MKKKRILRAQEERPRNVRWNRFVFVLPMICFLALTGCGGGPPPSSGPVQKKGSSPGKKSEDLARSADKKEMEKKEEEVYRYNAGNKPDPFKSFIRYVPLRASSGRIALTPLERYEISQLKLVAVIRAPEENIALVEDSAGKGYFLKKGTWIGKNEGKVKEILKDRVIVEETFQDMLGQSKKNEVPLLLHKPEEEGGS